MVYLHEKPIGDKLIRHWANEIEADDGSEEFETATYKIRQTQTGIIYNDAVDVVPCNFTYEATDEIIPAESEENEETEESFHNGTEEAI